MIDWMLLWVSVTDQDDGVDVLAFLVRQTLHKRAKGGPDVLFVRPFHRCYAEAHDSLRVTEWGFLNRAVGSVDEVVGLSQTLQGIDMLVGSCWVEESRSGIAVEGMSAELYKQQVEKEKAEKGPASYRGQKSVHVEWRITANTTWQYVEVGISCA